MFLRIVLKNSYQTKPLSLLVSFIFYTLVQLWDLFIKFLWAFVRDTCLIGWLPMLNSITIFPFLVGLGICALQWNFTYYFMRICKISHIFFFFPFLIEDNRALLLTCGSGIDVHIVGFAV